MDSILTSIKMLLGINEDDKSFDTDIIIHINTAFFTLKQLGAGPSSGFAITDESSEWSDFEPNAAKIEAIKTYIYIKVRLVFDPPSTAAVLEAYKQTALELEWRIKEEPCS